MKKTFVVLLALLLVLSAAACTKKDSSKTGAITCKDMFDREIVLDAPADKIVALSAGDCEILYAIGSGETLVGRGDYCDYPAEILEIPALGSGAEANAEEIIALKPQVVILSVLDYNSDMVEALEKAGITVVMTDADTIEQVYTAIELIGKVTGQNENAQQVIASMKASFDEIKKTASETEKKSIYFEVSPLQYGLWTTGTATFMDEIANYIGAANAFGDVEGWVQVSEEQVIERDPDYIITISMYYGEGPTPEEEIMSRNGWQNMTAIKENHVYMISSDVISRPGPRLADGALEIYNLVYAK